MGALADTSVARVESSVFVLTGQGEEPYRLRSGETLGAVSLAYEAYGELNGARDNAILVFHALSGSQHAAGYNPSVPGAGKRWTEECHLGWWDDFIGPGKALDTERYFVLCANYLGGCYGSTGPASISARTGRPYGASFPRITFSDTVDTQVRLLHHLGIERLHGAIGGSLGGMLCLDLATRYPDRVNTVVPIATGVATTPLQRIHNFEQIRAIERDPYFRGGEYYQGPPPLDGLALARMIAHKTFVSLQTLEERARLELHGATRDGGWYTISHALESYMLHQGSKFARRFDANTYLRLLDAWQSFRLTASEETDALVDTFRACRHQQYLVFSIDSDVCFYPEEQEELVRVLKRAGVPSMRLTVHSDRGHDAFLLEPELFTPHLVHTLNGRPAPPVPSSSSRRAGRGVPVPSSATTRA